jgi:two-component system sensor kinase FixL
MEKSQQIDKELAEAITQIANEAGRAGEIMDRLREIVKPGKINRNALNPLECLETALAIIRPTLDLHGVRVKVEKPDQLPCVLADQIQIEQVALNLIRNAMDALIDSNESNRDIDIKLETVMNYGWVKISVSNPGPPIPDDIKDELFNPFISSKEEGMGLGLAISRSIIESQGGEIGLENRDTGTTFFFTLPTDQNEFVPEGIISENDSSDGTPADLSSLSPEIADERH